MDVRRHHGGVHADFAAAHELSLLQVFKDQGVQGFQGPLAVFVRQLDERRGFRDPLLVADPAETPPRNGIRHFLHEGFIAQLVAELEIHQPQIRGHRHRRAAARLVEFLDEGLHEARVAEEFIHAGQLLREFSKVFGQDAVPQIRTRGVQLKHGNLRR
jgi:hypothetical protein